ncbi:DUF2799 domain-containing protein [Vibrio salinus]|uniref:DUF2799 domain-containing protein n=1 Tax=Vibrio salinus TaxID=2899784 RepID=UPI001E391580|nr:DUF2799 domain-containing protein [Vibrio salinus]MCE0493228.1 DUF2799 domain-containing protein [Vibrio salinus]
MKKWIALMCVLFLFGCSVTDVDLAKEGNWYQIGYNDGIAGLLQRSNSALSELGIVNQSEYDQGYIDGVDKYCNPNFAYQIGLSGQYYEGVCNGLKNGNKFRMEWKRGWEQYNRGRM